MLSLEIFFLRVGVKGIGFTVTFFKKLKLMILKHFSRFFSWIMFCWTQCYSKIYRMGLWVHKNYRRSFCLLLNYLTFVHLMNVWSKWRHTSPGIVRYCLERSISQMDPHQGGCIAINFTELWHLSAHYSLDVGWHILGRCVKFTRKPS